MTTALPATPSNIPPYPDHPPTAGDDDNTQQPGQWWRDGGIRDDVPPPPTEPPTAGGDDDTVYIPTPIRPGDTFAGRTITPEEAAAFWSDAMAEQARVMAAQIGQLGDLIGARIGEQIGEQMRQVNELLAETPAQRAAREQIEYEERIARQRAERDAAYAAAGETAAQRAERHRVEDILDPGPDQRTDFVGMVDMLAARIGETPEERTARLAAEAELDKRRRRAAEDARLAAAGETPEQRTKRHRQQHLADKREAAAKARRARRQAARAAGPSDRTKRFRRWCVLTAASATGGYVTGLIWLASNGGPVAGLVLAAAGLVLDLWVRDFGRQRVSEVNHFWPVVLLILARVPVASGLVVAAGLGPVFSALPLY
ncbi:hypothetical protein ACFV4P_35430 [Kitasatospora sp. NPDC059795]|uniref:hypothetical protein n=1 Tax=Kitasatospora sp. NPDC059795 TaxID=3346949 RepID=UPI0036635F5F